MRRYLIMLLSILLAYGAGKKSNIQGPVSSRGFFASAIAEINDDQQTEIAKIEFVGKSTFIPQPLGNATLISFSNGIKFDTRALGKHGEPDLPQELTTDYRDDEYGYYIVQIKGPIYEYHKQQLESFGAKIFFYVKNYSFVCGIENKALLDQVRSLANVSWAGVYQPAYKISSRIDNEPEEFTATILLFENADLGKLANTIKTVTSTQNKILTSEFHGEGYTNKIIRVKIKKTDAANIARLKEVYWVEPWHQEVLCNTGSQWCVQHGVIDSARTLWRKGIKGGHPSLGQFEYMTVCDTGIRRTHRMFQPITNTVWYFDNTKRKVVAQQPSAREIEILNNWPAGSCSKYGDEVGHGTHVNCSTAGNDSTDSTFPDSAWTGMARNAKIFFLDANGDSGGIFLPIDLNNLYAWPYDSAPAHSIPRIYTMTNSWGDSTCNGGYDGECMETDQFCWSHKDFLIFYSNGNDGTYGGSGVGHRSGSPASSKNVMAVGALAHPGATSGGADSKTSFSSMGLTADGRYKPDLATPGVSVISAGNTTDNGSASMDGTSMASPIAAGASLLARQYLKEGWYPTGTKTASDSFGYIMSDLIKAIMMHGDSVTYSAVSNPYRTMCADTMVGWGRVNLDTALYFAGDSCRLLLVQNLAGLVTGEEVIYKFNVPSGAVNLRITLSWTDYPSTPSSFGLLNDLDLIARNEAATAYYYRGNLWTTTRPYQSQSYATLPTTPDSVNVRESIRRTSPTAGKWTITVRGREVLYGPQPFALAITYRHPVNPTQLIGKVLLDKPVYRANDFFVDTVLIRVEDKNLGTAGAVDNATVILIGKRTETLPETLLIPEIAADAYVFEKEIPLLFHKAAHNDGKLSVAQADTITAIYVDTDPSFIDTMLALVDASYLLITDVRAELSQSGSQIALKWRTNENASQNVYYGLTTALGNTIQIDTPLVLDHVVNIAGLTADTVYYFDVESKDYRGNVVKDNNGNRHYSFSTVKPKGLDVLVALLDGSDKLTNMGDALPNLRSRFETAIKNGGWTYDWWETSDHAGFLPPRSQLKTYKAIFAPNEDEYPPFLTSQQETIKVYEQNGGRIAFSAHDFLWWAWDPGGGGGNPNVGYDTAWCKNYVHARYRGDCTPLTAASFYGEPGDSVTGNWTTAVSYSAHRTGAVGDSAIFVRKPPDGWDPGTDLSQSTDSVIWRYNSSSGYCHGVKWQSTNTHGSPGDGVWGGYDTRTIHNAFSITQMDQTKLTNILNDQFIWLIGHDHPDVAISSPSTGATYTTSPISIAWTATTYGNSAVDTTWIEYSSDAGGTWKLLHKDINETSPYSWNVTGLQNHYKYQVKVTVSDRNVYPSMKGYAATGNFSIKRSGGDALGPQVDPNSIVTEVNPKFVTATDTILRFTAVISDSETGLSNIAGARWYISGLGEYQMYPDHGSWSDSIEEKALGSIKFNYTPNTTRICTLQVRGCDNASKANNWGPYYSRTFTLIDGSPSGIGMLESGTEAQLKYSLSAPLPNPFLGRVKIQFSLPRTRAVSLRVYNCLGQLVRKLVDGERKPGVYAIVWDGRDDVGRNLAAGIYFYKFETDEFQDTKKAVLLR